jgi:hypothetical protein
VRRALTEQTVLRAVIREIISEAPYQSSQRVQLGQVRFKGPSLKGLLIATGVVGLIGLYNWMEDAFNCGPGANKRFPLVDTPNLFDEAKRAPKWSGAIQTAYKTQFNPNTPAATDGKPAADITRAFELYSSVVDAGAAVAAWPSSTKEYAGLTADGAKKKVADALVKTLSIYSNCPEEILRVKLYGPEHEANDYAKPPVELQTRDGYIKLLRDVVDNTHDTWVEGITEQRDALSIRFGSESTAVKADFDSALKKEDAQYKKVVPKIK